MKIESNTSYDLPSKVRAADRLSALVPASKNELQFVPTPTPTQTKLLSLLQVNMQRSKRYSTYIAIKLNSQQLVLASLANLLASLAVKKNKIYNIFSLQKGTFVNQIKTFNSQQLVLAFLAQLLAPFAVKKDIKYIISNFQKINLNVLNVTPKTLCS